MDITAEPQPELAARVKRVLVETLDLAVDPAHLPDDTSLYSPLVALDSLNLLQLSGALAEEFGGAVTPEEVMDADLADVAAVIRLVAGAVR